MKSYSLHMIIIIIQFNYIGPMGQIPLLIVIQEKYPGGWQFDSPYS